jgi:hypothetical protein
MEFVEPGKSVNFKFKINAWWENASVSRYKIESAEPYKVN